MDLVLMTAIFTTFSYIKSCKSLKYLSLCLGMCLLSGCLGGTVAQQIARSIATSIADKTIANAMDVNEETKPRHRQSITLQNRAASDLSMALTTTRFRTHPIEVKDGMNEPTDKPEQISQVSPLVRVQLFNLIIGDEKKSIIDSASSNGTLTLPDQRDSERWFVGSGIIVDSNEQIIFLIPPDIGKLASGTIAIVELANPGNLSIARYTVGDHKIHQAMDQSSHFSLQ